MVGDLEDQTATRNSIKSQENSFGAEKSADFSFEILNA